MTDRGRPVARLVPIGADSWADLVAAGVVVPATDAADIASEAPLDYGISASDALERQRADER